MSGKNTNVSIVLHVNGYLLELIKGFRLDVIFPTFYETRTTVSSEEDGPCRVGDKFDFECRDGIAYETTITGAVDEKNGIFVTWNETPKACKKKNETDNGSKADCALRIVPVTVSENAGSYFLEWSRRTTGPKRKDEDSESAESSYLRGEALKSLVHLVTRWKLLRETDALWSVPNGENSKEEEENSKTASDADAADPSRVFFWRKHVEYVCTLGEKTESLEYYLTEHLRMSGIYWGLGALGILGASDTLDRLKVIEFVKSCEYPCGGFGGNVGHDPHILYTLSAVQILAIVDALDYVDADRIATYVSGLQRKDGSFAGDRWDEIDTRFSYCALCCLAILGKLDRIDTKRAAQYIVRCCNVDGGFGVAPGAESHAGQIFCCVAALSICNALDAIDTKRLGWWLSERQCDSGGLNGRPEKQADVCYSWWTLSSLSILGHVDWIDRSSLATFVLGCQDDDGGGISDRPGDMVDIYHTYFGCCGLSLLGWFDRCKQRTFPVDPVFALPENVVKRLGIRSQRL